eukprot:CAMPEP_0113298692 /NCGR_PEP_ID=MMETSP0010_2-20120614/1031_1 /TAXON_ID=216773 ORGANISM="Corethron hystrix, Strain 308" /NCGR_SAMPLE_ID=MMETSP0010_2 /ASSEMBLY_ACC=CAM_ASM_000155 /LENGTH=254 /DNA_ID=CAMNT_0000151789 /DNA_START=86 /DNA_END=850 /DNA_ORIENTATION=- /assembly_acc=CAM_ASM_000155
MALLFIPSDVTPFSFLSRSSMSPVRDGAHLSMSSIIDGPITLDGKVIRGPISPLSNFILVRNKDRIMATSGGIFLPEDVQTKSTEGEVVAAGPGQPHPHTGKIIPMDVSPGQTVLYTEYSGLEMKYCDEDMTMIKCHDVMLRYTGAMLTEENAEMCRDWVLVKLPPRQEVQEFTDGIVVAATVFKEDLPVRGTVVKVGAGRFTSKLEVMPLPVNVGDEVKFREYAGNDVTIQSEQYLVIKAIDLLAVLKDPENE